MTKGTIIKKEKTVWGNAEYPALKHGPVKLIGQNGRWRLVEQEYEYLEDMYGYRPTPEIAIRRSLQSKTLGLWWTTISEYTYKLDTSKIIRTSCFGEQYDYEPHWNKIGFGLDMLNRLTQKK